MYMKIYILDFEKTNYDDNDWWFSQRSKW